MFYVGVKKTPAFVLSQGHKLHSAITEQRIFCLGPTVIRLTSRSSSKSVFEVYVLTPMVADANSLFYVTSITSVNKT